MIDTKEKVVNNQGNIHFGIEFAWWVAQKVDKMTMAKKMRLFGTYDVFDLPFDQVRKILLKDFSEEEEGWR